MSKERAKIHFDIIRYNSHKHEDIFPIYDRIYCKSMQRQNILNVEFRFRFFLFWFDVCVERERLYPLSTLLHCGFKDLSQKTTPQTMEKFLLYLFVLVEFELYSLVLETVKRRRDKGNRNMIELSNNTRSNIIINFWSERKREYGREEGW